MSLVRYQQLLYEQQIWEANRNLIEGPALSLADGPLRQAQGPAPSSAEGPAPSLGLSVVEGLAQPFMKARTGLTHEPIEPITRQAKLDLDLLWQTITQLQLSLERTWHQVGQGCELAQVQLSNLEQQLQNPVQRANQPLGQFLWPRWPISASQALETGQSENLTSTTGQAVELIGRIQAEPGQNLILQSIRFLGPGRGRVWQDSAQALLDPDARTGLIVEQQPYSPDNRLILNLTVACAATYNWLAIELYSPLDQATVQVRSDDTSPWQSWDGRRPLRFSQLQVEVRPAANQTWYGLRHLALGQAQYERAGWLMIDLGTSLAGQSWEFQPDQHVPSGCQIEHELSFDQGQSWRKLQPGEQLALRAEQTTSCTIASWELIPTDELGAGLWRSIQTDLGPTAQRRCTVYRGIDQFWCGCYQVEANWVATGQSGRPLLQARQLDRYLRSAVWDQLGEAGQQPRYGLVSADTSRTTRTVLAADRTTGPLVLQLKASLASSMVRLWTYLWCDWASSSLYTVSNYWPQRNVQGLGVYLTIELNGQRILPFEMQHWDKDQAVKFELRPGWNRLDLLAYWAWSPTLLDMNVTLATIGFNPYRTDIQQYHGIRRICADGRPLVELPLARLAALGPSHGRSDGRSGPSYEVLDYGWTETGQLAVRYQPDLGGGIDQDPKFDTAGDYSLYYSEPALRQDCMVVQIEQQVFQTVESVWLRSWLIGPGWASPTLRQYILSGIAAGPT